MADRVDKHETPINELDHVLLKTIETGKFEDDLLEETVTTEEVLRNLFDLAEIIASIFHHKVFIK